MKCQEAYHEDNWKQCRVGEEAFDEFALQQEDKGRLHTATQAFHAEDLFIVTGHLVRFQPLYECLHDVKIMKIMDHFAVDKGWGKRWKTTNTLILFTLY